MEPALPLPLRLDISHPPVSTSHSAVSSSIATFLSTYAARTGTQNTSSEDSSASSTGGVVAAQLTRLMNGLQGRIDYDAFTSFITPSNIGDDEDATPKELLQLTQDQDQPDAERLQPTQDHSGGDGDGDGAMSFSKN